MKNNIIFIGFMGVGKSSFARKFSRQTSLFYIDTDTLIEQRENKSVRKIFQSKGEEYFRAKEQECAYWLERSIKNTIISAGGGFHNVDNLKKIGDVIYLKSSFDGIINRLKRHPKAKEKFAKRPLLQDEKKALKLYKKRIKEYEAIADVVIEVENKSSKEIVKEILKYYK